jgi:hypothetical protein
MKGKKVSKFIFLSLFVVGSAVLLFSGAPASNTVRAFSGGPPAGHTGAPGEPICTECHTGIADTGPGTFELIVPSIYQPGEQYQLTIRHSTTDATRQEWGFQMTARTTGNQTVGDFQNLSGLTQIDTTTVDRQYIEHTFIGSFQGQRNGATWNVRWTAPSTDVGPVVFYAAGNQANNNGTTSGDQIYTARAFMFSGPPEITDASVNGKKLHVMGRNFAFGAQLRMDGAKVKKVSNDADNPTGQLNAKKAGKSISPGQEVTFTIVNPDGTQSEPFQFTRPL